MEPLEPLVERDGDRVRLLSPRPGLYTCAVPRGRVVGPGESVGALVVLGRARALVVPAGVVGRVESERPDLVRAPVDHGALLVEVDTAALGAAAAEAGAAADEAAADLVVRSPQTGRFYHRPGPKDDAFATPGTGLEAGRAVGLIEVMKTFAQVAYAPGGGLPERARFVRYLVDDGAEVAEGDPLAEVEAL